MAKRTVPGLKLGGSSKAKWVVGLTLLVALAFVVKSPTGAADVVKSAIGALDAAATSVTTFFRSF